MGKFSAPFVVVSVFGFHFVLVSGHPVIDSCHWLFFKILIIFWIAKRIRLNLVYDAGLLNQVLFFYYVFVFPFSRLVHVDLGPNFSYIDKGRGVSSLSHHCSRIHNFPAQT